MSLSKELLAALTLADLKTADPLIQKEIQDRQAQRRACVGTLYPGIIQSEIETLIDLLAKRRAEER